MKLNYHLFNLILGLSTLALFPVEAIAEQTIQVSLNNGSVIQVQVEDTTLEWTNVLADGTLKKQDVPIGDIRELVLCESPASKQVAEIQSFIQQLGNPSYHLRELAEAKLADPTVAASFQWLIREAQDHPLLEVRHRIARILDQLEDTAETPFNDFDSVVFRSGEKIEGDAGDFNLTCKYRNEPIQIGRKDIFGLQLPQKIPASTRVGGDVAVKIFHQHEGQFYLPHQTVVDFEKSPSDVELKRFTNVSDLFTPLGLRLGSGTPGYVGVSGYGFKFPLPPQGNSVCVFQTVGKYSKRFKGMMEIRFCVPGQPGHPAGVHEFGFFLARVNHSRDFVVEAFNASGQILATVESSDNGCVFAGVKSSEPVTLVRIQSNPYLFRLKRKIDEDYALDHLCFSKPVPTKVAQLSENHVVRLKNGDVLQSDSLKLADDQTTLNVSLLETALSISRQAVHLIQFPRPIGPNETTTQQRNWLAMLPDRSVIAVKPGKKFANRLFANLKLAPSDITGLWLGGLHIRPRFPVDGDFEQGKHVMVYPTARIAAPSVEFGEQGYRWNSVEAKKLEQKLNIKNEKPDPEDPTPNLSAIQFEDTSIEDVPTLWNAVPAQRAPGSGLIRLADGQQFVLTGPQSSGGRGIRFRFQIKSLTSKEVTLVHGRETVSIPLSDVLSIEFPE